MASPARIAGLLAGAVALGMATGASAQQRLVQRSEPPGVLSSDQTLAPGAVSTQLAPLASGGLRFVRWEVTSFPPGSTPCTGNFPPSQPVALRDALNRSINPVTVQLVENLCATAVYVSETLDSDADGVPDYYELQFYGDLSRSATADTEAPTPDGINQQREEQAALHSNLFDRFDGGGISRGSSALGWVITDPTFHLYRERSAPLGLFPSLEVPLQSGQSVTSADAPIFASGQVFGAWSVNGTGRYDALGIARNPVTSTISGPTTALAQYYLPELDSDADGLPDWYEVRYGNGANLQPTGDTDGDGLSNAQELLGGLVNGVVDAFVPGGVSRGMSAVVDIATQILRQVTIGSQPLGLVPDQSQLVSDGTVVQTPSVYGLVSGNIFAAWTRNGTIQRDVLQIPLYQVTTTASGGDLSLVAQFRPQDLDTDSDGLPDWFELGWFGNVSSTAPTLDPDSDGLTLAQEVLGNLNPRVADQFVSGGHSRGSSANTFFDLRPFPRIREALVDGVPGCFFVDDPATFTSPPTREPCGPFDAAPGSNGRPFFVPSDALPALGDWDGDGDLDLFVAYREGGTLGRVRVFENRGSPVVPNYEERPALGAAIDVLIGSGNARPRLAVGDVVGDGRAELVIGGETGTLWVIGGDGRFDGLSASFNQTLTPSGTRALPAFGEVTGDTRRDLLVLGDDGLVRVYPHSGVSTGMPYAATSTANLLGAAVPEATALSVADITEDGLLDVVVSDGTGRQWEFHKQASSFSLISTVYAGTSAGYAAGLSTTLGDLDGDGDTDVIAGFGAGGLMYLRNQSTKLTLDPPARTLVNGSTLDLNVRCDTPEACPSGTLAWRIATSRSGAGASIDPVSGLYQAGSSPGAVDVIEAVLTLPDGTRRIGRSYINVISATQQTQVARALIVTGRRAGRDAIWEAVNNVGNQAYRTLRHRGLAKSDIRYLSPEPNQDVDGDGILNDISGRSEKAAVLQAITQLSAGTERLYVLLLDHGVTNGSVTDFILNEDGSVESRLTAPELGAALNGFQGSGAGNGKDVVVLLDFCYAGGFLPALTHSYGPETLRVVSSASLPGQTVQMPAKGLLSFSGYWLGAGYEGFDLEHTFNLARESMETSVPKRGTPALPVQQPQLDDDGSGAQSPSDGAQARRLQLGRSFVVGQDIPIIDEISPDQVLGGARAEALIEIGRVSSVHPIQRAFCTVNDRPDNDPDPVVGQAEFELTFNRTTRKYEALVGGFTRINDPYELSCYVQDVWGSTSYPSPTRVTATSYDQRLLIVVGDAVGSTPRQSEANAIGNAVWRTARARGYAPEKIRYLNPLVQDLDGNSATTEIQGPPSVANLDAALSTWAASANELTVVLISGGSDGSQGYQIRSGELLAGAALKQRIYAWQDTPSNPALRGRPLNLLLEFDRSGALIPQLAPSGNEIHHSRVVLASTGATVRTLMAGGGVLSYTQMALSQYLLGRSYGVGHVNTAGALQDASNLLGSGIQRPEIDLQRPDLVGRANYQPGVANDAIDRSETRLRYFGSLGAVSLPIVAGSIPPIVTGVSQPVRLWAQVQAGRRGIERVYGIPVPPAGTGAQGSQVEFLWNPSTQRHEATSGAFNAPGTWNLIVYAKENPNPLNPVGDPGALSPPYTAEVRAGSTESAVRFKASSQIVTEPPNGQTVTVQIPVEISGPITATLRAAVQVNGTARNLDDYTLASTQLQFEAGAPAGGERMLELTVRGDNVTEGAETLILTLVTAEGLVGAPNVHTVTINPRDPSPVVFQNGFE